MRDGVIDDVTGLEFGWWAIWRRPANFSYRHKRDLEAEGSGEEMEADDNEEYDDEYEYDE